MTHLTLMAAIKPQDAPAPVTPVKPPSPAAERALAEVAARRLERERAQLQKPKELAGRAGPDPTRYGDWEVKGIASDF